MVANTGDDGANRTFQHVNSPQDKRERKWGIDPAQADIDAIKSLHGKLRLVFGWGRYFPIHVEGWERLPEPPVLLVSNHSGGTLMLDTWGFFYAWHEHFHFRRIVHSLGHEILFKTNPIGRLLSSIGSVNASTKNAIDVLQGWSRDLIVMPGGDQDAWRPFTDRYRVTFANRRGYARLAIRAGVPIVPIANAGPHSTFVVLARGDSLARAIGLPEIVRAAIIPVHISLPWGLAVGALPHIPLPRAFHYHICSPISPPRELDSEGNPREDAVEALDAEVRAKLQLGLDELSKRSRTAQFIHGLRRLTHL